MVPAVTGNNDGAKLDEVTPNGLQASITFTEYKLPVAGVATYVTEVAPVIGEPFKFHW